MRKRSRWPESAVTFTGIRTKWFKPAKGQFQIFYKLGTEQPEYIPDFVAETSTTIFIVETKARGDVNTPEVQAKAAAARMLQTMQLALAQSLGITVSVQPSHLPA
jgi:hypothetical protein